MARIPDTDDGYIVNLATKTTLQRVKFVMKGGEIGKSASAL